MSPLCAEFGISRKTGYKIYERYKQWGVHGLTDRSRRPYRHANQLPRALEDQIVDLKREFPDWGGAQDSRASATPRTRRPPSGHQHRACGPGSAPAGDTPPPTSPARRGDDVIVAERAQRALVR
jgi:hypothetical protein